ncbi:MAG: hypothetical protein ABIY70_15465 [Capsulimonas sp.]|uniref:hypothetical protein n=1 Tax=Capsulimonas sp. TaxID=2494211 RepID=UPI0032632A9D
MNQEWNTSAPAILGSVVERGIAIVVAGAHTGASIDKYEYHHFETSGGGFEKRRLLECIQCLGIRAGANQHLRDLGRERSAAYWFWEMQRRTGVAVPRMNVRSVLKQYVHELGSPKARRDVQGSVFILADSVDVSARTNQHSRNDAVVGAVQESVILMISRRD